MTEPDDVCLCGVRPEHKLGAALSVHLLVDQFMPGTMIFREPMERARQAHLDAGGSWMLIDYEC